jgi:uncharacterized protein (DUF2252 family)
MLAPGESVERGRAARKALPRSVHGDWTPAADRPDPVGIIQLQAATRLPELIPIRYGRMRFSAFTFFRGAAAVMAADLARTPNSGIVVQTCGDAHIANFGGFAAPDRRLLFGPNDFDETLPGPWEWDVKRMAASVEIAARDVAIGPARRERLVLDSVKQYREAMRGFAEMSHLDVWYERIDASELVDRFGGRLGKKGRIEFAAPFARAHRKDHVRAVRKLTEQVDGKLRFRSVPPLLVPMRDVFSDTEMEADREYVTGLFDAYAAGLGEESRQLFSSYRFVDLARKVVGVGSVGTRAGIVLLAGRDGRDPLVLQAKEAQASVLEPYLGRSSFGSHGERVVHGQRLSQVASDIFLSWMRARALDGEVRDFYVRQLWDWKASIDLSRMRFWGLHAYVRACGWSLARMHARSGDRLAIAGYLGRSDAFDRAIARFATAYADQNEHDHLRLEQAIAAGEIQAQIGV